MLFEQARTPRLFEERTPDLIGNRTFGFWLYMLSDVIIYAALFAAFSVLHTHYAGGPTSQQVVEPLHGFIDSVLVFSSAWLLGLSMRAMAAGERALLVNLMALAALAALAFVGFESYDFAHALAKGESPQRSGYLSIYFVLLGLHALHIFVGILWMLLMMVQVAFKGLTEPVVSRLLNLKIFFMFQSVIWVCVFVFIYLLGAVG
ncbi:cytochrome c oxidase subunit 3 [Salinisphaera sp. RV14]|uniref:cytochrome c oxidase subunit 3 n=1 Tax=unclassified Salinisphaera TaxID=2649847 RepID=UPI003F84808B